MGQILNRLRSAERVVVGLIMIHFVAGGGLLLLKGELLYKNYWGGLVFAPVAILLGSFGLYLVLFRWKELKDKANSARLKGRAARRARRSEKCEDPIDFDKPWRGGT